MRQGHPIFRFPSKGTTAQIGNLEKRVKGEASCEGGLVNGFLCRGLVTGVL